MARRSQSGLQSPMPRFADAGSAASDERRLDAASDGGRRTPNSDVADALLSFSSESASPASLEDDSSSVLSSSNGAGAASEDAPAVFGADPKGRRGRTPFLVPIALLLLTGVAVAYVLARPRTGAEAVAAAGISTGTATIDSDPSGADVLIDGVSRGSTPLRLSLPAGTHQMDLRYGGTTRTLQLEIAPDGLTAQYIEFATTSTQPVPVGRLEVSSDPPGARVTVDGAVRGTTPLMLDDIQSGEHEISVVRGAAVVSRRVTVDAGSTATVMASLVGAANAGGWVSILAPIELQVFDEGDRLVGTTNADRLMLPAGNHELVVSSSEYRFRTSVSVRIVPGQTASHTVTLPSGSLSVNALPWAEVFVDGAYAGVTPLANLALPIGRHEITWRHPDHGERRQVVPILAESPTRVGVDFTQ